MSSAISSASIKSRLLFKLYVDSDDEQTLKFVNEKVIPECEKFKVKVKVYSEEPGKRPLSDMHNFMFDEEDELIFLCGDDVVIKTMGWDMILEKIFSQIHDKIALVYGKDEIHNAKFAPHYVIHKNWVKALGYVSPPYYTADWSDTWMFDIAQIVKRNFYVDELIIEHLHWSQGKSEFDDTASLCERRRKKDNNEKKFRSYEHFSERMEDAKKLYKTILESIK